MPRRTKPGSAWLIRLCAGLVAAAAVGYAVWAVFFSTSTSVKYRQGIVVMGNPVVVVSWDPQSDSFVLVRVPRDSAMDATHGYGSYSLDALWKLDGIDKRRGELITSSVEETLATPVSWYMDAGIASSIFTRDPLSDLTRIFSPVRVLDTLLGRRTNIPFPVMLHFVRRVSTLRGDEVKQIDTERAGLLYDDTLADGSKVSKLDPQRFDAVVGDMLEDERIRKESMRIAVLNTTDMPGLGQRVARLLNAEGSFVTSVGNEEPPVAACEVTGNQDALKSLTAAMIITHYGCTKTADNGQSRADIVLKVGTAYASRFKAY